MPKEEARETEEKSEARARTEKPSLRLKIEALEDRIGPNVAWGESPLTP